MIGNRSLSAIALALALATTTSAYGSPTTYFAVDSPRGAFPNAKAERAEFLATLDSFGVDTLDGFASFTPDPTLSFGATGITATTQVAYVAPFAAVSGTKALLDQGPAKADQPGIPDIFTLSAPVTAFGYYVSNIGDGPANVVTITLENISLGTSKQIVFDPVGSGLAADAVVFFGVTDADPFDRVTISESYDYDGTLYDDITVGFLKPVPEPGAWLLTAIGAGFLFAARRRA